MLRLGSFASDVRSNVLTGLSTATSAVITAADTVLGALGKLQAQLSLAAPLASPSFTGTPTAPTPAVGDNDTSIATTAYVIGQASSATPLINGTAAAGTATAWSRGDHVHPSDTTRAPLASPSFSGEAHFANGTYADPDGGVSRDAKYGSLGIAVRGGTKTDTLTVTGGATFAGTVALAANPTLALQAAPKQYVDAAYPTLATVAALRANTAVAVPVFVQCYATAGDDAGGTFIYVSSDTTSSDNGGTIIVDASSRRWYRLTADQPRPVTWFGAKGDGTTDDTTAINAAISSLPTGGVVFFPPSSSFYKTTGSISIGVSGITLMGSGKSATTIKIASASLPAIAVGSFLTGTIIRDMTIDRSVTATSGGNGINNAVSSQFSKYIDLIVQHHFVGLILGPTGYSLCENVLSLENQNAGFLLQNTAAAGAVQWSLTNCLAQGNAAQGFLIQAVTGAGPVACGEFTSCATYANTGCGFAAAGLSTAPIYGVRINGGFFGQDNNHEVYLDTYGGEHKIVGLFTELAGTLTTGPAYTTAASNVGAGFHFTANNVDVQCEGCYAEGHSQSGFISSATEVMLNGCKSISNGVASISGDRNGFYISAGRAMITGSRAGNISGTTSQSWGVSIANGASGHLISDSDLNGNVTGPISVAGSFTNTTIVGCTGCNLIMPLGGIAVGVPTGGAVAGAINAANGLIGSPGTSSAAAGTVGEYVASTSSTVALTSGAWTNLTTISLTAGDWDICGNMGTTPAGSTVTGQTYVGAGTTSAAAQPASQEAAMPGAAAGLTQILTVPRTRLLITTTTTVYLVANVTFSVSTLSAYGTIDARRVR